MTSPPTSTRERRRHARRREELFCPAVLAAKGRSLNAYVVDVSKSGAQLKRYDDRANPGIEPGMVADYDVYTNAGRSSFSAAVQWVRPEADGFCWGVRFTRLPSKADDPLLAMLDGLPAR